ncbi:MAG: hypothetical protein HY359_07825 [Candidatus Rokubacteria bacterium]|nr:hypothetical protein [Candidatus Rokubacteria bacterium]
MPASCAAAPSYEPRRPETSILYRTVQAHLESFLAQTAGDVDVPRLISVPRLRWGGFGQPRLPALSRDGACVWGAAGGR